MKKHNFPEHPVFFVFLRVLRCSPGILKKTKLASQFLTRKTMFTNIAIMNELRLERVVHFYHALFNDLWQNIKSNKCSSSDGPTYRCVAYYMVPDDVTYWVRATLVSQ